MRHTHRSLIFDISVFFGCLIVLGYFGWYGFAGPRSVEHRDHLGAKVVELKNILKAEEARRDSFNRRVALLRPQSIDPDLLEELARKLLGFARPNDMIVFNARKN